MSGISTHILDTARGRPAQGVPVILEIVAADGVSTVVARNVTDTDGRVRQLLPEHSVLESGTYRLTFDTRSYFAAQQCEALYPQVAVTFIVRDANQHYHIPLLLSPFGYSTYRGT